jgi:hypothetical protein
VKKVIPPVITLIISDNNCVNTTKKTLSNKETYVMVH